MVTAVSPQEKQDTAKATDKDAPEVAELPTRSSSARSKKEEVDVFLSNLQEALEDFEACDLEARSFVLYFQFSRLLIILLGRSADG